MSRRLKILPALVLAGLAASGVAACSDRSKPTFEFMPNMMDSPAVKAYEEPMRLPPEGAIPRGFAPYPYSVGEGETAGLELKNPLPFTKENIMKGQKVYNNTCIVCHGAKGDGNGSIVPKFPRPPALTSDKVANWPDGRIFHVITRGQNLMGSYASQIPPDDRWAAIHYVRALRRAAHPTGEDVEALKKELREGTYP
ncbi:MAG: cytochrome c [Deltaproteobacteria bacterium]|nr:cytochrome c [Deltaproteobacteria bacterium]